MEKHFVTFFSPGTLVAETTETPIEKWDTEIACEMAHEITERYGATPYAFQFTTRSRGEDDLDSKVTERSGYFYLGGEVLTLEDIKARGLPDDKILISNMEVNHYTRVVENNNSWKWTQPLKDGDHVLDWEPRPKGDA